MEKKLEKNIKEWVNHLVAADEKFNEKFCL